MTDVTLQGTDTTAAPPPAAVRAAPRWGAHHPPRPGRPAAVATSRTRAGRERVVLGVLRLLDGLIVLVVLLASFVVSNLGQTPHGLSEFLAVRLTVKNLLLILAFLGVWRLLADLCRLYDPDRTRARGEEALRVLAVCALGSTVALIFPTISISEAFSHVTILYFWIGATVLMLGLRSVLWTFSATSAQGLRNALIVGSGPRALELYRILSQEQSDRYRVLGFVDGPYDGGPGSLPLRTLGPTSHLDAILMREPVDEVLIALPQRSCYAEIQRAIEICEQAGVEAKYLADAFRVSLARPSYDGSSQLPVITLQMVSDDYRLALKRVIDVLGAVLALVIAGPLMLLTAVAVKLSSRGPVIFAQERYGRNRRRMKMYKFRTMVSNAEEMLPSLEGRNEAVGPIFKIRQDPRLTPVGRILRRYSIDELPQLWNVLRGEMSLVGPRPMSLRDVALFSEPALMRRFSVTPGITGLWQVSGRSNLSFDQWIALDLAYIDRWSLWLDFKILLRTPWVVLRADGAA
jgi:exopolysaccharide biosynthesis polyprenyl glycosylphosphotransferase